jgi:hypothetical protein
MFAYNPTPDRSGEIMAAGQMQAAQTNAQMMGQLGQDIGGALSDVGKMYGSYIEDKVDGESSLQIIKGLSDSGYKPFADIYKNLMTLGPRAAGRAAQTVVGDAGGWISQVMIAGQNAGVREKAIQQAPVMQAQRVTDQREIMYEREQLARERQAMSTPPAPAAVTVPPTMRRFGP